MKRYLSTAPTALLALALVLAACAPASTSVATQAPAPAPVTLRTGYIPVIFYAPLYLAIERGYFAAEGITLELTPIQSGNDAIVQLAAGNFDVALGGANAGLFNAVHKGLKFQIVAPLHSERPPLTTPLIISAKNDTIKTVADLKGKKVAVNALGAGTEYWLNEALKTGGLTMADIQLEAMPFANIAAALDSGQIDAAVMSEPFVTTAADKGLVKILKNDYINGFTATYVFMSALATERPEVARGFLRAYIKACRELQGDYMTDELAGILEKYTKVPADVAKRLPLPQFNPDAKVPLADLEALQKYFMGRGLLDYSEPLDLTKLVNTQLAEEAAKDLGK
ncbi:MAG: ABC transporter substrate-binding protein [Anaerolineales bacterium]|nr:ABC transporter substrate-binding protein [Anaerolineales bacterium]